MGDLYLYLYSHLKKILNKRINSNEKLTSTPRSELFNNLCAGAFFAFYFLYSVVCIDSTCVYYCSCLLCAVFEPLPPDGNPLLVNKYRIVSY